jgi:hypothetical protein
VSWDFLSPVFPIKQLFLILLSTSEDFAFLKIIVELFVFVIDSQVMYTSRSWLEFFPKAMF